MALKLKIRPVFTCGRCRRKFSNPLGHVCVSASRKGGRVKLAPGAVTVAKCDSCGKQISHPLAHVCGSKRGDFSRRKAEHAKRVKAARRKPRQVHDYRRCRDEDCRRVACEAWREAWAEGREIGRAEGYADAMRGVTA